jgi:hypothetical protein
MATRKNSTRVIRWKVQLPGAVPVVVGDVWVWSKWQFEAEVNDRIKITADVTVDSAGPAARRLVVETTDGRPLPHNTIRNVQLGRLVDASATEIAWKANRDRGGAEYLVERDPVAVAQAMDELRQRARPVINDRLLTQVASIYRSPGSKGKPTKTVAEQLGVSISSASAYVREARRRNFLGPATPGRAGERPL